MTKKIELNWIFFKKRTKRKNTIVLQQDLADCGVACLASIVKFHQGEYSLDQLRKLSGTSSQGTTLLGLLQAARAINFEAEGLEADSVENLKELTEPAILHVVFDNKLQHYVVYYPHPTKNVKPFDFYLLGDPSKGLVKMNGSDLNKIWQSKALLKLVPTKKFERAGERRLRKRKWMINLLRDDFPLFFISIFLGIIISVLGISTAIFSQKLIDDILPRGNTEKLVLSLILVTLLLIARSGLNYMRGFFMIRQSIVFNNRIIHRFYSNLLDLPKSFFDTRKTGDLVARMNDTRRIQSILSTITGIMVVDLLLIFVSIGFVFSYSFVIATILLASLLLYFLILYTFNQRIVTAQREVMAGYAMAESNFIDTMQGVADIKLLNKQSFFEQMNSLVYGEFQKRTAGLGRLNIKFGFVSDIVGVFIIISVFAVASWLVISKKLRLGEMVALLGMAGSIVPSLTRLIISNIQIQEALIAFDRMFEFTAIEKEESEESTQLKMTNLPFNELSVEKLSFRFVGKKQILREVSMRLVKGEITAFLGESGQGKSTLLQIIQKFYRPEGGSIMIDGHNLGNIDTSDWRSQIGSISQEPKIFNGNLLYNITLSDQQEDFEKAVIFCEESGFGEYFNQLPQGYFTMIGEEGVNLSGGQKQLVVLARVLFEKPRLLLLDEATSSMDRNTENFILRLLQKEKAGRITLMVTHRIKTAQRCDRIVILENGSCVNSGTPNELLKFRNFFSDSHTEMVALASIGN